MSRRQRFPLRSRRRRAQPRRLSRRRRTAARRDRTVARRQDGVHHRARQQSHRAARGCRCSPPPPKGASRGRGSSRSRTTRCRASPTRIIWQPLEGADRALAAIDAPHLATAADDRVRARRGLGLAGLDAHRSTSSTIPANGCSTCRCSTRATRNGRARRWRRAQTPARAPLAAEWRASLGRPRSERARATRTRARRSAELFTAYLERARDDVYALSTLPPGRFLMPGDLEGSPALTFAPLPLSDDAAIAPGSLAAMMARRYEAYKAHVVRPFFRDHFARLDRQIVLVDALAALNSGPAAVQRSRKCADRSAARLPRRALVAASPRSSDRASTASCSRRPRPTICIIRATTGSRRSCALLTAQGDRARRRASARRSTSSRWRRSARRARREIRHGRRDARRDHRRARGGRDARRADCSTASPRRRSFPANCRPIRTRSLQGDAIALPEADNDWRFVRFRPPLDRSAATPAPQIRLDRALQFLIGDRLA